MASIEPAIRTPNKTVEGFVPVLDTPTIQKNFMRAVGFIVPIGIGNEDQFGGHTDINPTHTHRETRAESQVIGKSLLLIKDTIPIDILKNLDAVSLVRTMGFSSLIIVILQGPKPSPKIEAKGNRFADVRLGHEGLDLEALEGLHVGNRFIRSEKGCVAGLGLSPDQKQRKNQRERD